jgi:hypothetical protein
MEEVLHNQGAEGGLSKGERRGPSRLMQVFCVPLMIVVIGTGILLELGRRAAASRRLANDDVVVHAQTLLPAALKTWKFTESGDWRVPGKMDPDRLWDGSKSKFIAYSETKWCDPRPTFGLPHIEDCTDDVGGWYVLAKTEAGRYFEVTYHLYRNADEDITGVQRMWAEQGVTEYSLVEAKRWLWKNGTPVEYKGEFGEDPPPTVVVR